MKRESTFRRWYRNGVLVVAFGGTVSCTEPLAPSDIEGSYVATRASNEALPVDLPAEGFSIKLLADTLRLDSRGRGQWTEVFDITYAGAPSATRIVRTHFLTTEVRGTQLRLRVDPPGCGPLANCLSQPSFYLLSPVGGELYLTTWGGVRRYERIQEAP